LTAPFERDVDSVMGEIGADVKARGPHKAVAAVTHATLTTIYHLLTHDLVHREPGEADYDARHAERVTRRACRALERQGYRVALERAA